MRSPRGRGPWAAALMLASASSIWGGMYVVSKVAMEVVPPWTLLTVRLLVGGGVLAVACAAARRWPPRLPVSLLWAIGACGPGLSIGLQFVGTHLTSASMGALITSASPAFIALFARALLGEALTPARLGALTLALAGTAMVVGLPPPARGLEPMELEPGGWVGALSLVGAAVTWALYSVLVRMATVRWGLDALVVTAAATLAGSTVSAPAALREAFAAPSGPAGVVSGWTAGTWAAVAYLSIVSTALAFFLWNRGLELLPASTASLFFFLQPVVGASLGAWLLGERLSGRTVVGGIMVLAAVTLASRAEAAQRVTPAPGARPPLREARARWPGRHPSWRP